MCYLIAKKFETIRVVWLCKQNMVHTWLILKNGFCRKSDMNAFN